MTDRSLETLIEEITVDAYGDEGFDAFACYFVDEIGLPRHGLVVGEEVDVVDVFFDGDERRGLSADADEMAVPTRWPCSRGHHVAHCL